jgi:hypothetical protein
MSDPESLQQFKAWSAQGENRLAAAGRLRSAVALELSPGLMWAAGRLGPRDIGDGLRSPQ